MSTSPSFRPTTPPPPSRCPMADRPTVDFDHHSTEFHDDRIAKWAELRTCPVAFNERHGGFWVVSGHDVVEQVSRDGETYSSEHRREVGEDGITYLGIAGIPRG